MIRFEEFTGGVFETNCFLLFGDEGNILIDAPQASDEHFSKHAISALLLTHGHFDHVADAAAIQARHSCPVYLHPDTVPMVSDPDFFRNFGFGLEVEPLTSWKLLTEGPGQSVCGFRFDVLEVPGHCPGSLCFSFPEERVLFGGDVLFRGGVGRWDLPGGDYELLISGIRKKVLPLGDQTIVYPGHGESTTIGEEKSGNPWLQED